MTNQLLNNNENINLSEGPSDDDLKKIENELEDFFE